MLIDVQGIRNIVLLCLRQELPNTKRIILVTKILKRCIYINVGSEMILMTSAHEYGPCSMKRVFNAYSYCVVTDMPVQSTQAHPGWQKRLNLAKKRLSWNENYHTCGKWRPWTAQANLGRHLTHMHSTLFYRARPIFNNRCR